MISCAACPSLQPVRPVCVRTVESWVFDSKIRRRRFQPAAGARVTTVGGEAERHYSANDDAPRGVGLGVEAEPARSGRGMTRLISSRTRTVGTRGCCPGWQGRAPVRTSCLLVRPRCPMPFSRALGQRDAVLDECGVAVGLDCRVVGGAVAPVPPVVGDEGLEEISCRKVERSGPTPCSGWRRESVVLR